MGFDLAGKKIFVAGHGGMVGQALLRALAQESCTILTVPREALDLREQADTAAWLAAHRPDAVIIAAAKVGGIAANAQYPADFLYDNLAIASNLIHAAQGAQVQKLLFLGSSCIYPKDAPQPMQESALLTGPLEPTNEWYAIAKIAGVKLCQAYRRQYGSDFISVMPTNLYGPHDRFDPERSHVIPALMLKLHRAKETGADHVDIWGSGQPRREFLHVDDLAAGCVMLLKAYSGESPVNIGYGEDITIAALAEMLADIVGYRGQLRLNPDKPDGPKQKLLSCGVARDYGWEPRIPLRQGLADTYQWFLQHAA